MWFILFPFLWSLSLQYILLSNITAYRVEYCAESALKRDLSNELYAKTRDYDSAKRWIDNIANTIWDMEPSSIAYNFSKCNQQIFNNTEYMNYIVDFTYPIGYINDTKTDLPSPPYVEGKLDEDMRKVVLNLNYLLPLMINSTAGALAAWVLIGVKHLLCGKLYNEQNKLETYFACGFPQDMWTYYLKPYREFIGHDEVRPEPSWTRPTYDALVTKLMSEYIHPLYVNDSYYGQLIIDIDLNLIFGDIVADKPKEEGFNFVISLYDYSVVAATDKTVKLLFNKEMDIVTLYHIDKAFINMSTTGFNEIGLIILKQLEDHTVIHSSLDNTDYYVSWALNFEYQYALCAAIPITTLRGASWTVEPETLQFKYSSDEKISYSTVKLKNTGSFELDTSLAMPNYVHLVNIEADQINLDPNTEKELKFSIDIENLVDSTMVITFTPNGDNYECFSTLLLPVDLELIDCKVDDYDIIVEEGECTGTKAYKDVYYKWKSEGVCRGGISLPSNDTIPCEWLNSNIAIQITTILIVVLCLVNVIFQLISTIRNYADIRIRLPPTFFICSEIGFLFMIIALVMYVAEFNKANCTVMQVFRSLGSMILAVSTMCTLSQINTKFVNDNIVFLKDIFYLLEFLLPTVILEALIIYFVSPYFDNWDIELGSKIFVMKACRSSDNLKYGFRDILIFVVLFVNFFFIIRIYNNKKKIGKSTLQVTRSCFYTTVILLLNPLSVFATSNKYPNTVLIQSLYMIEILSLALNLFLLTPFKKWYFRSKTKDISPDTQSFFRHVLTDPIMRFYLKKHMKDLLTEENMVFWEAVTELRSAQNNISDESRAKCVEHIFNRFIRTEGDCEININHKMKEELEKKMKDGYRSIDIFDEPMKEIENLMFTNAFYTFMTSTHFQNLGVVLKWYENYSKLELGAQHAIYLKSKDDDIKLNDMIYFINGFDNPPEFVTSGTNFLFSTTTNKSTISSRPLLTDGGGTTTPVSLRKSGFTTSSVQLNVPQRSETSGPIQIKIPLTPIKRSLVE